MGKYKQGSFQKLYFAGEAASVYPGTLQGAYYSGIETASALMKDHAN
jgi:monoamine oxidase